MEDNFRCNIKKGDFACLFYFSYIYWNLFTWSIFIINVDKKKDKKLINFILECKLLRLIIIKCYFD